MWDIVMQNLPTIILVVFATIICGAELIKAIHVWRDERDRRINGRIEEQNHELATQNAIAELITKLDVVLDRLGKIEDRLSLPKID
jgi:cation transport regulator ChaB